MTTAGTRSLIAIQLDRRTRRRLILACASRIALSTCSLLAVYFLIPIEGFAGRSMLAYFAVGATIFVVALAWQVRAIVVSDHPGLQAAEAIGLALPLFVVLFAILYVAM